MDATRLGVWSCMDGGDGRVQYVLPCCFVQRRLAEVSVALAGLAHRFMGHERRMESPFFSLASCGVGAAGNYRPVLPNSLALFPRMEDARTTQRCLDPPALLDLVDHRHFTQCLFAGSVAEVACCSLQSK